MPEVVIVPRVIRPPVLDLTLRSQFSPDQNVLARIYHSQALLSA